MNKRISVAFALAVLLGSDSFADAAVTDPSLSYSANFCQPQGNSGAGSWFRSPFFVQNKGTTNATLLCPAVKKDPETINGTTFAPIWISTPTNVNVNCTLYAVDALGNVVASKTQSSSGVGQRPIYFSGPNFTYIGFQWGHWVYSCSLPPNGSVTGYFLFEEN